MSQAPLSKEVEFTLLAAKVRYTDSELGCILAVAERNIEWLSVEKYAGKQRVLPLVRNTALKHCRKYLSAELVSRWRTEQAELALENLQFMQILFQCLDSLQRNSITAVPFKGPGFTCLVYGDLSLRQFCDLDILVAPIEVGAAVTSLQSEGFKPRFILSPTSLNKLTKTDNEFPLVHESDGICLDLQWELTGGYFCKQLTLDVLGTDLVYDHLFGKQVVSFGREDMLLYLCIHGCQHLWQQLDHVCCINEFIRAFPDLGWKRLFEKAKHLGAIRMLKIGLMLAVKLFSCQLPPEVVREIKDKKVLILVEHFSQKLTTCSYAAESNQLNRRFSLLQLACLEGPRAKIRYLSHLLFTPTRYDFELWSLPAPLTFLYRIIRPMRLLKEILALRMQK